MNKIKTFNWIEYNTYSDTPLVYVAFCTLLFASILITFWLYRAAINKKQEIKDPEINNSYSDISIRIISWIQFDLLITLMQKILQVAMIAMNT